MSTTPSIIPFDKRDGYIWMNGELIAWGDARVHVLTHGLHYGSSVFEGERAYKGKIYQSRWHTERFFKSAEIMDFTIPYTIEEIEAAKALVVEKNGGGDQYVRPVAFRGSEMMAVSAQHNKIHVAIATWKWPSMFDPATKMKGIRLDIADDLVGFLLLGVVVDEFHRRAELDRRAGELRHLDDLGAADQAFEFADPPFVVRLRFLGRGIFRILGKVTMRARFLDGDDDAWPLDSLAVLQFVFQHLVAVGGHGNALHGPISL
jgi:hypothetical protein